MSAQPNSDVSPSTERRLDELAAAIDRDADVPIGLQLGWALSARIHDGELRPGQRLPGLREMAQASGLNVNTVRAVYQRLEQRGLIESQQGSGTFVSCTFRRPSAVGAIAADAAREAEAIGVDPREVAAALYVAMPQEAHSPVQAPTSDPDATQPVGRGAGAQAQAADADVQSDAAATHRRVLRAQIGALERAIAEMEAEHPGVAPRSTATRRGPGPTLLSAEELEQVRSALVHRLAQVQSAIDERAAGDTVGRQSAAAADTAPASSKRQAKPRSTARPAAAGT